MTLNETPESEHGPGSLAAQRAMVEYFEAIDAGTPISVDELIARYPDGEDALREFFKTEGKMNLVRPSKIEFDDEVAERFAIRELLGQGGMGRVYRAFDPRLRREIALKIPVCDLRSNADARERFFREGQIAASIQHPNFVSIYEFGEDEKQCFIVSEYVDGPNLHEWLVNRGSQVAPREAASLVMALAQALETAHANGILHRDLKPANVLLEFLDSSELRAAGVITVDETPIRPRITDFGLACFADDVTALTTTGAVLGTAAYMAPEQATGQTIGPQADVFALGLILFELLFGRRAFENKSVVDLVDRFRDRKSIELPATPDVPRDLKTICERSIQFDTAERYESAHDLAEDLGRFLVGDRPNAAPVTWKSRSWRAMLRPERVTQAGYAAIALQGCLLGAFTLVLGLHSMGVRSGITSDITTAFWQIMSLFAFPIVPGLIAGVFTVRRKLLAYWLNCLLASGMAYMLIRCFVTGESHLSYYDGNDLAFFATHALVLSLSLIQFAFHVVAFPASLQIRKSGYWPKG